MQVQGSLFQLISNNRVGDFGIDHDKRIISFIRAGLFLELFVQRILREIFIMLSKLAAFGRFWPVVHTLFLYALWRSYLNIC